MRYLVSIATAIISLARPVHATPDTLFDLAHMATWSARVEVTRTITLKTGDQQVNARVIEQITGKPLLTPITIWNGNVTTSLPQNTEGRGRFQFHAGEYLVFLERETDKGFTPCVSSWVGFAEIRDGIIHWRSTQLRLADVLRDISRTGTGPK